MLAVVLVVAAVEGPAVEVVAELEVLVADGVGVVPCLGGSGQSLLAVRRPWCVAIYRVFAR